MELKKPKKKQEKMEVYHSAKNNFKNSVFFALSTAEMQLVEGRNPAGSFLQLYFPNM